ncbi:hypothetical protein [Ahrensia kielensis]|uniref:hypothetical protein n=1 Tax=Ahrensia kielensis TaxID=76980 RepID=UPI000370B75F|nr:hypothetical protein [Ahrensia kielensis]
MADFIVSFLFEIAIAVKLGQSMSQFRQFRGKAKYYYLNWLIKSQIIIFVRDRCKAVD